MATMASPPPPPPPSPVAASAWMTTAAAVAFRVLTDSALLRAIGSFRVDVHAWIRGLEAAAPGGRLATVHRCRGPSLVREAIVLDHRRALAELFRLSTRSPFVADPRFTVGLAIYDAASLGRLAILQWLYAREPPLPPPEDRDLCPFAAAIQLGHAAVVEWLCQHQTPLGDRWLLQQAMRYAAEEGYLDVLQCCHHQGKDEWFTPSLMDLAARAGRLEVVTWLHTHRPEGCTTHAMDHAAMQGHWDVVRFLHDHRVEGGTTRVLQAALEAGNKEMAEWLAGNRPEGCTMPAIVGAFHSGVAARLDSAFVVASARPTDPVILQGIRRAFRDACAAIADPGAATIASEAAVAAHVERFLDHVGPMLNVGAGLAAARRAGRTEVVELLRAREVALPRLCEGSINGIGNSINNNDDDDEDEDDDDDELLPWSIFES